MIAPAAAAFSTAGFAVIGFTAAVGAVAALFNPVNLAIAAVVAGLGLLARRGWGRTGS